MCGKLFFNPKDVYLNHQSNQLINQSINKNKELKNTTYFEEVKRFKLLLQLPIHSFFL